MKVNFKKVLNGFVDSCSWLKRNELRSLVEIVMKENSTKFEESDNTIKIWNTNNAIINFLMFK